MVSEVTGNPVTTPHHSDTSWSAMDSLLSATGGGCEEVSV